MMDVYKYVNDEINKTLVSSSFENCYTIPYEPAVF